MERGAIFTIPNIISLSRLLLALGFVVMHGRWERTAIIIIAAVTDVMDGWMARRENGSTLTGALIDPFADRVFVLAAVSAYLIAGWLTTPQFLVFLARDIATAVGFVVARFIPGLTASAFRARALGKSVTVLQMALLLAVLQWPAAVQLLIIMIGILSAISIVDYTLALSRSRARAKSGNSRP